MGFFGVRAVENIERLVPADTLTLAALILEWVHRDLQGDQSHIYYKSAEWWLNDMNEEYIFSFPNVCSYFGLDREETKKKLYAGRRYVFSENKLLYISEPKRTKRGNNFGE